MEFEFDVNKSASNFDKHGINFEEAKKIWDDPFRIEIPARSTDEERTMVIGMIKQEIWSGIICQREKIIRIISVRKASRNEREIYYSSGI